MLNCLDEIHNFESKQALKKLKNIKKSFECWNSEHDDTMTRDGSTDFAIVTSIMDRYVKTLPYFSLQFFRLWYYDSDLCLEIFDLVKTLLQNNFINPGLFATNSLVYCLR